MNSIIFPSGYSQSTHMQPCCFCLFLFKRIINSWCLKNKTKTMSSERFYETRKSPVPLLSHFHFSKLNTINTNIFKRYWKISSCVTFRYWLRDCETGRCFKTLAYNCRVSLFIKYSLRLSIIAQLQVDGYKVLPNFLSSSVVIL